VADMNIPCPVDIYEQERQYSYKHDTEVRSRNLCCSGKAGTVFYSDSLPVALFIQNEKRMRHIIL
jgi:hypothetical protein